MENTLNDNIEIVKIKKSVGRPKKYENGAKEYEKESKYHQKYYHATNKEVICNLCGKKSTARTIYQHKRSVKCKYFCLLQEKEKDIGKEKVIECVQ